MLLGMIFWTIRCTKILKGQFKEKNSDALLEHETQGNFIQYFPGKEVFCWSGIIYLCLLSGTKESIFESEY
jgi:hypothetical protein